MTTISGEISSEAIRDYINNTPRAVVFCYRCGAMGHFRSECVAYKTRICHQWKLGHCVSKSCPFAHGADELRNTGKRF